MLFRRPVSLPGFPEGGLLVGGAARDYLRGVPPKDFDWAVPDPEAAAWHMATRLEGKLFVLDAERGYWRVHGRGQQHDFVPLPADLTEDLFRRDFTVNAIALDERRKVIDPSNGRADLKRKQLRMVSPQNLHDDPLRIWRAVRFEYSLGFRTEEQTETEIRYVASLLAQGQLPMPAPERVRDEVHHLLLGEQAAYAVRRLEDLGLLELTVPELRAGIGMQQGNLHHLDVFEHNLETLNQLVARFPAAELPLRWAALLHDVAKPATRTAEDERTHYHGHETLGAEMTRQILGRLRLSSDDIARASALVRAHMVQLPQNDTEAKRFVHRRRELLPDLIWLLIADREAARGPMSNEAGRQAYKQAIDRILFALEDLPAAPTPLLDGSEIMHELGLTSGPAVGEISRALAEAQALGQVRTREEALSFIEKLS